MAGWHIKTVDGRKLVRCEALLHLPGVGHAFSTRHDKNDDPDESGVVRAAGLAGRRPLLLRQVHGAEVRLAHEVAKSASPVEGDALLARHEDSPHDVLAVLSADCVPVLLADRRGRSLAAVHAGWRGVAARVVVRTVEAMRRAGIDPAQLTAALGPAIGSCCYEVGQEVVDRVSRAAPVDAGALVRNVGSRPHLDLRAALRSQLEAAGFGPESVHLAPWCTACERTLFFSYRRAGGSTGRQIACIGWTSERGSPP